MAGKYTFWRGYDNKRRKQIWDCDHYAFKLLKLLKQQKMSNIHYKELIPLESSSRVKAIVEISWD